MVGAFRALGAKDVGTFSQVGGKVGLRERPILTVSGGEPDGIGRSRNPKEARALHRLHTVEWVRGSG